MVNYMMGQDENVVWAKCAICRGRGTDCGAGCITKQQKVNLDGANKRDVQDFATSGVNGNYSFEKG